MGERLRKLRRRDYNEDEEQEEEFEEEGDDVKIIILGGSANDDNRSPDLTELLYIQRNQDLGQKRKCPHEPLF